MKFDRQPDDRCVSVCGLYCGACPAFPEECHGCLSDFVRDERKVCKNGFRECAAKHNITRCNECPEFPCKRLEDFSKTPVINGICNHAECIPDLFRLQTVGIERFLAEKAVQHTCRKCGLRLTWFDCKNHKC